MSTTPIAGLPMYDWPEIYAETDRLWRAIGQKLGDAGIAAPTSLERDITPEALWRSETLLVAQTCGFPYRMRLQGHVSLVGTPCYGIAGCAPGDYFSVVICRDTDSMRKPQDMKGSAAAYNAPDSQSGYSALRHLVAPLAQNGRFFSGAIETGSHRDSIRAVATGRADVAAIDAVTWELALRHEPAAKECRVFATTPPTPGLPIITSLQNDPEPIADAIESAIGALSADDREALLINGFRRRVDAEYEIIERMVREAFDQGYQELG